MPTAFDDEYLPFFDQKVKFNVKDYTATKWRVLDAEAQEKWVEEVFRYYRDTYGFPYPVMSPTKIRSTLGTLVALNTEEMAHGDLIRWNGAALALCSHYFPNIWKVPVRDIGSSGKYRRTAWEAFQNDDALKDAIRLSFRMKSNRGAGAMPNDLIDAFSCGCGKWWVGVPSRFKPATAKFIWEQYAPPGGIVYDYACGWGGRLLGAATSKKNLTYVGVDPNLETVQGLKNLRADLVEYCAVPEARMRIEPVGSEDFCPDDLRGKVDVAFSSPPYYNLEAYSDDPTQSHVKYATVDSWLEGFLFKTVDNCFTLLKPGGVFAINIKDTAPFAFVDRVRDHAKAIGLVEETTWRMEMKQRRGAGAPDGTYFNYEPIYVFRKP